MACINEGKRLSLTSSYSHVTEQKAEFVLGTQRHLAADIERSTTLTLFNAHKDNAFILVEHTLLLVTKISSHFGSTTLLVNCHYIIQLRR